VNLSPAWIPKHGSCYDLAIAVAILAAQGAIGPSRVEHVVHLAELGLDGSLRTVPGVLPALIAARRSGIRHVVVAAADETEARLVTGIEVDAADDLAQVLGLHGCRKKLTRPSPRPATPAPGTAEPGPLPDFSEVVGQAQARFAAEAAAAGGHHLLFQGPPGAGKTMIASRIPGILPLLDDEDALAVSAVQSVAGRFDAGGGLVRTPPFVSPHHTASVAALVGGGSGIARPGAISRAHGGVLFLDEVPEFDTNALEALRQPLESGSVTLMRASGAVTYPSRFQLVLAANPCPCGNAYGKGTHCRCSAKQRRGYLRKISGPIRDRIDIRLEVGPVPQHALGAGGGEPSAAMAQRVAAARDRQRERFGDQPWDLNARIPGSALRGAFAPARGDRALLETALARGRLTLRGYDRVLRLAWTLADLDAAERPTGDHIGRALTLRGGDQP
jgi:magnesium chelatase family protein